MTDFNMRRPNLLWFLVRPAALLVLQTFGATALRATMVDVFFVGGQSNATTNFYAGVRSALIASGQFPNSQVVWKYHPGRQIATWFDGSRQTNYLADLYDPSAGMGALETACSNIVAAGNSYRLRGFFWFQGEGDTHNVAEANLWPAKITGLLNQLATDLNGGSPIPFAVTLIAYNPSLPPIPPTTPLDQVAAVAAMRTNQLNVALASPVGSYADSWGYARSDTWHLTTSAATSFGSALANAFIAAHPSVRYWDATPTAASPGAQYGAGNWGVTVNNTNWWNGDANVPWNNTSGDIAVFGVNIGSAVTVTLTNSVTAGGIIYSNAGTGVYTLAGSASLTLIGSSPLIQLSGPNGTYVVNPPLVATGTLSIATASTNTGITIRPAAASNNISALSIGTPGNASYASPTALYVDVQNSTLANVLNNTTNVVVYSNATLRVSGQNASTYNLAFPKQITLSGDGQNGTRGAWVITGNAGGSFGADVVLAGDSTVMISSGGGGTYTYTEAGTISGAGNLKLVNDSFFATRPTVVLSGGPHTYTGNTTIGGNLTLNLQGGDDRLPTSTALTLGIGSVANGATITGYGKLVLGSASGAVNQTLAGLQSDGSVVGCAVVGGNASTNSILTVSNAADFYYAAQLGGVVSPDNHLAFIKDGVGTLVLAGSNACAGYTVGDGTLQVGNGVNGTSFTGPMTNNATLVFNVAGSLIYSNPISGTGFIIKTGPGTLRLDGSNYFSGSLTVSNGTLGGNGVITAPVVIQPNGTIAPGASIGLLTIGNTLTLSGSTVMQVDKVAATNDSIRGLTAVSYGGTLVVSNLGVAYAVGDSFKLFDAQSYSGAFTNLIPSAPGPALAWNTRSLITNGTLLVVADTNHVNLAPVWNTNPVIKAQATVNSAYAGTLADSATDPNPGDTLTFSLRSGPAWLTVTADGSLGGTPSAADVGTNSFTVRVTDSGGLSNDATLLIPVVSNLNSSAQLASPDGRLVLTFAVTNFDGAVNCPAYSLARTGQVLLATSKLGMTFGSGQWRQNLTVLSQTYSTNDSIWQTVVGERSSIRDNYNQLVVELQETVSPFRTLNLTFRAYNEGVAFRYTIPTQAGFSSATNLSEQSEFRFSGNYTAWSTTSAQGVYSSYAISSIPSGTERPLPVQVATNLYLALGEARLLDYARMKFSVLSGKPNSLVSVLDGGVANTLPMTSPWRFIMVADRPGQLLENNFLVLNLNDPCALTNTAWIKPGKVIREVTLTTTGAVACVNFAARHRIEYVLFDAGWYGPENTTLTATNVNVDPARSPGPLDLSYVIRYAASNNVGIILYVNWLAMTNQLNILPPLYQSWGVKGIKYGFVGPNTAIGQQTPNTIVNQAVRICATNQILFDAHDEFRVTGYERTYPNLMTVEGISGDETTPSTAQDCALLFSRMLAGPADHTMCYFESRVTNNWSYAYQLAKAVCFYSPLQHIYWYDRPTNSAGYVSGGNQMINEVPELELFDNLPTVWDETRVLQGSIGQYAVIARRSGANWFVGAMNAGSTRTFNLPLDFLPPGQPYVLNNYQQDATVPTRTRVRIDRFVVDSTTNLTLTLAASRGQAVRLTPAVPPAFQKLQPKNNGTVSLVATGSIGTPYSLWTGPNLTQPDTNWMLVGGNLVTNTSFLLQDSNALDFPRKFYRFSTP